MDPMRAVLTIDFPANMEESEAEDLLEEIRKEVEAKQVAVTIVCTNIPYF